MVGHDKITPAGEKFLQELKELEKFQVRVGFQRGEKNAQKRKGGKKVETETDILDVAMWNELGTSNGIPSRPFLRQSVDKNVSRITSMCRIQLKALAKGEKTAKDVLEAIGVMQKGLVQNEIRDGGFTPNAPSTIAKKGSDKPLIDTGRMRQSVNFVIKPKGEED